MNDAELLAFFKYPNTRLIGSGQESTVYDIGDGRVIKLLRSDKLDQAHREEGFYAQLQEFKTSFRFPRILEIGTVEDRNYLFEEKLSGVPLKEALTNSTDSVERKALLEQMLFALKETRAIIFDALPYGELISPDPLVADTWMGYFEHKVRHTCRKNKDAIAHLVPDADQFVEEYLVRAARLCATPDVTKSLVHGDYWPPNILVENGKVSAVIDFNDQTLVGDYRIDIASAIIFSEKLISPEELSFLKDSASMIFGIDMAPFIDLYAVYYALLFIGLEKIDPGSYEWAVRNLLR